MTGAERARLALLTAPRGTELDRWRDLYDLAVPRPGTCPAAAACESCAALGELALQEADTPVGVICLTLCDQCAEAERTPRLGFPAAIRRVMAHEQHTRGAAGVAS